MAASIVQQKFMLPGVYSVDGEPFELSADDLAERIKNTKEMMAAGLSIPVLFQHEDDERIGGPQFEETDARNTAGWVRDLWQDEGGEAFHKLEITDDEAARKLENGSIKYTSPEFTRGDYTDGKGRNWGPVIRHVALTAKPRNPDQGKFEKVPFAISFSLANRVISMAKRKFPNTSKNVAGQAKAMWGKVHAAGAGRSTKTGRYDKDEMADEWEEDDASASETPANSDSDNGTPAVDLDKLLADVVATLGLTLPDGVDVRSDAGLAIVLTAALNKSAKATEFADDDDDKEDKDDKNDKEDEEVVSPVGFSEPVIQKLAAETKHLREQIARFSEERAAEQWQVCREDAGRTIAAAHMLPGHRAALLAELDKVSFSESGRERIAALVAEAKRAEQFTPRLLQFDEGSARVVENALERAKDGVPRTMDEARELNKSLGL